jgi:3-oxoacyl-[acyl-carrier protein] reductase
MIIQLIKSYSQAFLSDLYGLRIHPSTVRHLVTRSSYTHYLAIHAFKDENNRAVLYPEREASEMKIKQQTLLITGASRGIGKEIALELARQGATCLILVARDRDRLILVAEEIRNLGATAIVLPLDLTKPVDVTIAMAQAWQRHGPIHGLVNCAGIAYQSSFLDARICDMEHEISTNLVGLYSITKPLAKRMAARKEGTIVNVSSLMGKVAAPSMATYSATKFAILGFTQALRQEMSLTETDMVQDIDRFKWMLPMTPQQVAKAMVVGLRGRNPEIVVGWQGRMTVLCDRILPGLVDRMIQWAAPVASSR